jgi:hypothetical protein
MQRIDQMIRSHPNMQDHGLADDLGAFMALLSECEAVCRLCADACLHEDGVEELRLCIERNLACAAACQSALAALASTAAHPEPTLLSVLDACTIACAACASECRQHASHHEHCRICAEVCAECEQMCAEVITRLSATLAIDIRRDHEAVQG